MELHAMLVADQIQDRRAWERIVYLAGTVRSLMGDKHPPKNAESVIGPAPSFGRVNRADEDDT